MAAPLSPTRLFTCTACGAVLPVGEEFVGKKCRCGRCGKVSVVGAETPRRQATRRRAEEQVIGFSCRVCDTRLAAQAKHVGRKAKCPDCGALTAVPPPSEPTPPRQPRAMHGQQYGLWDVEGAPTGAELAASQPKFYPVWCRVCDTLMHARINQVGKKLTCPDCGAKTVFKEPPPPMAKKSVLVPDGLEYQIDTTNLPPSRPLPQFAVPKPEPTKPKAELPPIREERRRRPKMPRVPIVQGVLKMLVCSPVTTWIFWLTGVSLCVVGFLMLVVSLNPIAAIPFFFAAGLTTLLQLGALSALCVAVLTESSEGNDRLYNPPGPVFLDWAGDVFYLAVSATLALAPWWLLCRVIEQDVPMLGQAAVMLVGWLFTFPLLLLSSLENGSAWEPFSPRIFGSVARRPGHWLLLVIVSGVIVGATVFAYSAVVTMALRESLLIALLEMPLLVVACLIYFRILGRFAWWLAESLAEEEAADGE